MLENVDTCAVNFKSHSLWLYTTRHRVLLYVHTKVSEEMLPPSSGCFFKTSVSTYNTTVSKPMKSQKNQHRENLRSYIKSYDFRKLPAAQHSKNFPTFIAFQTPPLVPILTHIRGPGYHLVECLFLGRDSSVSIVTGYGLDSRDSIPCRGDFCSSSKRADRLWGPHSILYNRYNGCFPGVKRAGREADHSPPSSSEVKTGAATTSLPHTPSWSGKVRKRCLCA
jgi:hypothetical protein